MVSKYPAENPILVLLPRTIPGTNSHKMGFPEYRFWKGDLLVGRLLGNTFSNTCVGTRETGSRREKSWMVMQSQWRTQPILQGALELQWTWKADTHLGQGSGPIYSYSNQLVDTVCPWRGSHNIRTGSSICLKAIFEEEFSYELSTRKTTGSWSNYCLDPERGNGVYGSTL